MSERRTRTTIGVDLLDSIRTGRVTKQEILKKLAEGEAFDAKIRGDTKPKLEVTLHKLHDPDRELYTELDRAYMHDLSALERYDVLRVGRHPDQDLHVMDKCASREHGLIVFAGPLTMYCDYGTLRDGERSGSLNGTWINGSEVLRDHTVAWHPDKLLMLGSYHRGENNRRVFQFKLSQRKLTR